MSVTLTLRDSAGNEVDSTQQAFDPGQHRALFVDELFSGLSDFSGSLTFQSDTQGLGAVTLRQSTNLHGEAIFATLPVADLSEQTRTDSLVFPQMGAGPGLPGQRLSTQLVLINKSDARASGQIKLFDDDGAALELELDGVPGSEFPYAIEPNGTFQGEFTRTSGTGVGYAVVTDQQRTRGLSGSAVFQYRDDATDAVLSEAEVQAIEPTPAARILVDQSGTQTGVAIASPNNPQITVMFDLLDSAGKILQQTTRELPARGHLAIFVETLFPDVSEGFVGLMEIRTPTVETAFGETEYPIAVATLKLTTNARNHPILTTLPIVDLTRSVTAARLILPQIGFGDFPDGTFATRLILINGDTESEATGQLNFLNAAGSALTVPLGQETNHEFPFGIPAGGGRKLQPGVTTIPIAEIILDPANPQAREVVINLGNTFQLSPRLFDSAGNEVQGAVISFSSLSPEIAPVDPFQGVITAQQEGFSTLTVTAGGVVKTATITVVDVTAGIAGFQITGVVQDLARRLYLANTSEHTILLAQDLETTPEVYAGMPQTPGLINDERVRSLFHNPAHLAFDQARGSLYVSDSANHVIRLVGAGSDGRVETLAGTGEVGSTDGSLTEASFNDPQGMALDNRGNLWVVDSANHTIRRINLATGTVETIAGQAGSAGLADGTGEEARFNTPAGIAIELESLAQKLERETRGEPSPAVSVIVADTGNGLIRRVRENGQVETVGVTVQSAGKEKGRISFVEEATTFDLPAGVAVDSFGTIYVTEPGSGQLKAILHTGEVVKVAQADTFLSPNGVTVSESGKVVVADADRSAQQVAYGVPEILTITPDQIGAEGGAVLVKGKNFAPDSLVVVAGVVISGAQIQDTETITFVAPVLLSGRTTVTVQNRGGLDQASLLVDAIPLDEIPEGYITTVAGGTTFTGDGSPAQTVPVGNPVGVALDAQGNLYIAGNARIRRVDAVTGIITAVAGNGEGVFSGDGGPATAAGLGSSAVEIDRGGNLLIAGNNRIRQIDAATGIITTIAGNGESRFSGDEGPASEAALRGPSGVMVDSQGNLFIADTNNDRIRRVDVATGIITTVAGNGERGFSGDGGLATEAALRQPRGVAVDRSGNLFIVDSNNHRIRKVDALTGIIDTVVGIGCNPQFPDFDDCELGDGGPATEAALSLPAKVVVDQDGNLLIADRRNSRIRKVEASTGIITTVAGNGENTFSGDGGPAVEAALRSAVGVAVDGSGNLLIADRLNNRIRRVDAATGIITTVAGNGEAVFPGDGGPATVATLRGPLDVALDGDSNLFILERSGHRVRKVEAATGIITTVAGIGAPGVSDDGGLATEAALGNPRGVALDSAGNLFIADGNGRIRKVDAATGIITTVAGIGESGFSGDGGPATEAALGGRDIGVALDEDDNLFIADEINHRIRKVEASTGIITTVAGNGQIGFSGDGSPATEAALDRPIAVAVDRTGNLFIADFRRIRRVEATNGVITTVAGNGQSGFSGDGGPATEAALSRPRGVVVDGAGNLLITDSNNNRIRKVDAATGIIATVAGNGESRFSGDGGPAMVASLNQPFRLAVDRAGNLFFADTQNRRIRVVRGIAGRRNGLDDDFNDNFRNPNRWRTFSVTGFGPTIAEVNQRLEITHPANSKDLPQDAILGVNAPSVCLLSGDFDIQMDYDLLVWPPGNGVRIGLSTTLGTVQRTSLGRSDQREMYFFDSTEDESSGRIFTNDQSGKLRQVRLGNTVTGYYWSSGSWVVIHSGSATTEDMGVGLASWSHNSIFGEQAVVLALDNFRVNAGTVLCP